MFSSIAAEQHPAKSSSSRNLELQWNHKNKLKAIEIQTYKPLGEVFEEFG